jgi:hypothetical protein
MNRPDQMKDRNLRRQIAGLDEIRVLQTAFLAKTNRAYIAAAITLYTLLEFVDPTGETLRLIVVLEIFRIILVIDTDLLFMKTAFGRFQIGALRPVFEIGRTTIDVNGVDLFRV